MVKNLKGIDLALLKVLNDLNTLKVCLGHVAEWLRRGLQILLFQFDSGRGLHLNFYFIYHQKKTIIIGF